MFLHGNSPEVSRLREAMGNHLANVKSITLRIRADELVSMVVERFVNDEEIDALADMLETCHLVRRQDGQRCPELPGPIDRQHYRPQEIPPAYPLELTTDLHVCLWDGSGRFKWTIALWRDTPEGPELTFIANRPLDARVDWNRLREVVEQGQRLAELRWRARQYEAENQPHE